MDAGVDAWTVYVVSAASVAGGAILGVIAMCIREHYKSKAYCNCTSVVCWA